MTTASRNAVKAALSQYTAAMAAASKLTAEGNETFRQELIDLARRTCRSTGRRDAIRTAEQAAKVLGEPRVKLLRAELLKTYGPPQEAAGRRAREAEDALNDALDDGQPLPGEEWHEVARRLYGATFVHTRRGRTYESAKNVASALASGAQTRYSKIEFRVRDVASLAIVEGHVAAECDAQIVTRYLERESEAIEAAAFDSKGMHHGQA
jgi:hypothetical protein